MHEITAPMRGVRINVHDSVPSLLTRKEKQIAVANICPRSLPVLPPAFHVHGHRVRGNSGVIPSALAADRSRAPHSQTAWHHFLDPCLCVSVGRLRELYESVHLILHALGYHRLLMTFQKR